MLNRKKSFIQTALPHIIAIVVFTIITLAYFLPLAQGKVLRQGDVTQYVGASQELRNYYNEEGESSVWTGSMFSGMPAYHIGIWGQSPNFFDYVEKPIRALAGDIAAPTFIGMLAAYILFILMGFRPSVSIVGAIAYSFSTYNFIILDAGHLTKAWAIAYMPLIFAGVMVMFKRRYLLGGILMALGLALQLKNNHMQMTYYTGILCGIVCIALAFDLALKKDFKGLGKAFGTLTIAVILAAAANYSSIYNNYIMSEESIRGESELTSSNVDSEDQAKQSSGLKWGYVFDWSYGKSETFSLLVPNIQGGVSKSFSQNSEPYKELITLVNNRQIPQESAGQLFSYTHEYWGNQPFTQGPVYFGAIICFLFVLGMFVIRSKVKWVLFAVTIFFIFLAWGKNMEWFNDLFYYYFPLYNKFRAVSSALVIPALTMVMIAVWGLSEFLNVSKDKKKLTSSLYLSVGIIGGICLILWIAPGAFFNFVSGLDEKIGLSSTGRYFQAVVEARKSMLSSDALRSLVFIILAATILWFFLKSKSSIEKVGLVASILIAVLVLADLWSVDRRFLNDSNYESKLDQKNMFVQSTADKFILQDNNPSYRVLNTNNTFQEALTSYYHKSMGGYSAAKLRRYQELIDHYLNSEVQYIGNVCSQQAQVAITQMQNAGEQIDPNRISVSMQSIGTHAFANTPILNMLNAKYTIYHPQLPPVVNDHALGNAWFVSDYSIVNNADEEIAALKGLDPARHAIIDKRFEQELGNLKITPDSIASIELTTYKPNKLTYKTKASSDQLAVFSEIYFPHGWEVSIDGKETNHLRADWTLRAMRVPAGEHEIIFEFIPHEYLNARLATSIFSGLLVLLILGGLGFLILKRNKEA